MPDRLVRFTESFFVDLDDQLPEERSASGAPSATDFLLYDLPRLRDALASGFEASTLPVPDLAPIRVLVGAGTLVAAVALYAFLDARDFVVVVSIEIEIEMYPEVEDVDWRVQRSAGSLPLRRLAHSHEQWTEKAALYGWHSRPA